MTSRDLVTAGSLAHRYGVKSVVYGPPGAGKTPLLETLIAGGHRAVLCVCEPGMGTLRESKMAAWAAFSTDAIMDFVRWRLESAESKQFDVTVIDSGSELAETFLRDILNGTSKGGNKKHGLQAYGDMAQKAYSDVFLKLYLAPDMHVVITCKEMLWGDEGMRDKRPSFPGQVLPVQFPHLYDNLMRLESITHTDGKQYKVLRCESTLGILARNRNRLDAIEPADLSHIIRKSLEGK